MIIYTGGVVLTLL